MQDAFKASSTELFDLDTTRRGWTVVEMTPTEVTSKWRFVSTILESQYQINESEPLLCRAGDRRFSERD